MATLQTNPDSVPDDAVEWTRELNVSEIGRVGKQEVNFTLWDETSTVIPSVIEGSIIELSNSIYVEGSTVPINITGQQVNAINWVIYEVSGSVATAYLKPTAPTASDYDVAKGGFYNGSGHRYTGHFMFVSAAGTAYSNKGFLDYANGAMLKYGIRDEADVSVIDADLIVNETITSLGGILTQSDIVAIGELDIQGTGVNGIAGSLEIAKGCKHNGHILEASNFMHTASTTFGAIFAKLTLSMTVDELMMVNGVMDGAILSFAYKTSSTSITLYYYAVPANAIGSLVLTSGGVTVAPDVSIAW